MSQEGEQDTMREEYDFSGGIRGKHYEAYRQGTNLGRVCKLESYNHKRVAAISHMAQ